jgi:hypothetical protein
MRLTPAAARVAAVNDLPLSPTMKLKGLPAEVHTARTDFQIRQPRRHQRVCTGRLIINMSHFVDLIGVIFHPMSFRRPTASLDGSWVE